MFNDAVTIRSNGLLRFGVSCWPAHTVCIRPDLLLIPYPVLPDIGGALRLGGATTIRDSSFVSNLASSRGLAVAAVGSVEIHGSSFRENAFLCREGDYMRTDKVCPVSFSLPAVVSNGSTEARDNHAE